MKHFLSSKTNQFAMLTFLVGVLTNAQQLGLSTQTTGYIVMAVGFVNFILRTFYTSTPVSLSKPVGDI